MVGGAYGKVAERSEACRQFWEDIGKEGWKSKCRIVVLDGRLKLSFLGN